MTSTRFVYLLQQITAFGHHHRLLVVFLLVAGFLVGVDELFHRSLFHPYVRWAESAFALPLMPTQGGVDMGYAPEVWLALLSVVLGTLIIVISIASQSIPKLIDLYMQDWISLCYVWLLILSAVHAFGLMVYGDLGFSRHASRILNVHFLLPVCTVIAFPYIFYILQYTRPNEVIDRIFRRHLHHIHALKSRYVYVQLNNPKLVGAHQLALFEALNQLSDLLEYVSFKEPKADILQRMNLSVQAYVAIKPAINRHFFTVSPRIRSDISFKTMIGQFGEMERTATFYEQKCFRLLGNAYIKMLEQGQFDLAALCTEMTGMSLTAIEAGDTHVVDLIIMRYNTMLRFAIKHGVKNNEARHLYNLAFHYGNFIEQLVRHQHVEHVKRSMTYLRLYGTEIFTHGHKSPAMYFIVDVIAAEMKRTLMLVYEQQWDLAIQNTLLSELLQVDSPPDVNKEDLDRGLLINNGVRVLQVGLALFYLRQGQNDFVRRIVLDVLEDLHVLGKTMFRHVIDLTCDRLKFSSPTFWEDTDRGNLNLYYTADQEYVDQFRALIAAEMAQSCGSLPGNKTSDRCV